MFKTVWWLFCGISSGLTKLLLSGQHKELDLRLLLSLPPNFFLKDAGLDAPPTWAVIWDKESVKVLLHQLCLGPGFHPIPIVLTGGKADTPEEQASLEGDHASQLAPLQDPLSKHRKAHSPCK